MTTTITIALCYVCLNLLALLAFRSISIARGEKIPDLPPHEVRLIIAIQALFGLPMMLIHFAFAILAPRK